LLQANVVGHANFPDKSDLYVLELATA